MDSERRKTILAKILIVWDANSTHSLMRLLKELSGRQDTPFLLHVVDGGVTEDIKSSSMPARLDDITDDELEEALNGLLQTFVQMGERDYLVDGDKRLPNPTGDNEASVDVQEKHGMSGLPWIFNVVWVILPAVLFISMCYAAYLQYKLDEINEQTETLEFETELLESIDEEGDDES